MGLRDDQAGKCDALLLAGRENLLPIIDGIKTLGEMGRSADLKRPQAMERRMGIKPVGEGKNLAQTSRLQDRIGRDIGRRSACRHANAPVAP